MATRVVTVNDILDGQVGLDLECFDRIYLNGWVPILQVPGQVVNFLTRHLGFPIPSPAILEKIAAPRGALSYSRFSREEFGGTFLSPMPYLESKDIREQQHGRKSVVVSRRRERPMPGR